MRSAARLLLQVSLLLVAPAVAHDSSGETYYANVGHLLVLRCHFAPVDPNVTWSSDGRSNFPPGVEVRDGMLWFLPVHTSHNGSYACETRDKTKLTFHVLVSAGNCPDSPETIFIYQEISAGFPCKQDEVLELDSARNIRWTKDCGPLRESVRVNDRGFLRLPVTLQEDAGKYTCLVDVSIDGKNYTAARSIQVNVKEGISETVYAELEVVYPQHKVVDVEVGRPVKLECLAYAGFSDDDVLTHWTIDSTFHEELEGVSVFEERVLENKRVFHRLTLTILEVRQEFLNVPIRCTVQSPADEASGVMWLQEADHSAFHATVATFLAPSLLALALLAAFLLFRIDVLLAHRRLRTRFSKNKAPDGKLYDAYVSFLHHPAASGASDVVSFALSVLPEKLEKQHGYSLYIRGRDDCPGEAMHDAIDAAMRQCRRLIIILSPVAKRLTRDEDREDKFLCDDRNQLAYEQKIGLFDALTQNDPKVVLVEIGSVDYSPLPESLRYIKRKQGALKWENPSLATSRLSKLFVNRNFWKNMIYQMPSVPMGKLGIVT
ncbi:interleukin-1 receptor-like 2 isoform X1 [Nelusetta ayraudi]|uniref:interleukin-1 receptor-like 2 isoform X1 n=1 Tax=Nelusetta ayraudi TaxID=303726 RepID=UPI003F709ADC